MNPHRRIGHLAATVLACLAAWPAKAAVPAKDEERLKTEFLRLCDLASAELNKDFSPFGDRNSTDPKTHHVPFFEDSYAVRALAVAYDLTGKKEYLDACQRWSDRIIELQGKMLPKGAYYLNYGRAPGQDRGEWFVADAGCVGMGVLATAVRTADPARKQRYLASVRAFAQLVIDNYVGKEGGVANGHWSAFAGPWWCSTATFGSLMFLLYDETGDPQYLRVASGAMDWMTRRDFRKAEHISFEELAPGVVFYVSEFYAAGLGRLEPGSQRRAAAVAQIDEALKWMAENQKGRGAKSRWDYLGEATYMGGMPYLMRVFARSLPERRELAPAADQELRYLAGLLLEKGDPPVSRLTTWELMTWSMMSYAERLGPGKLFRGSQAMPGDADRGAK